MPDDNDAYAAYLTMIETLARAAHAKAGTYTADRKTNNTGGHTRFQVTPWEAELPSLQDLWRNIVTAAIETARLEGWEMVKRG